MLGSLRTNQGGIEPEKQSQFPAGGTRLWRVSPTAEPWCETAKPLLISTGRPFSTDERGSCRSSCWCHKVCAPLPRVPLNQGGPPCSSPAWPPGPRQGWATGSDRFWLRELRVSRTFLDQLWPQLLRPRIPNSMCCHHFLSSLGPFLVV